MKIRRKTYILFMSIIMLSSCSDWMTLIPPQGLVREEFWKTKEDVQAVLMGAYETLAGLNDKFFLFGEMRGDMITGDNSQPWQQRQIQESNIYSTNYMSNWQQFYVVINYCNEIIKNAPEVQEIDETFSDFILQGYLSEAYFIRSLTYFYLVRIFKDVPYIIEPTESDDSEFYLPKTNGDQILQDVLIDLNEFRAFATSDGFATLEETKGRATKASFDALMADINLWLFNYDEVITHVENIERNKEYVLLPGANWFDLFYPGNSLESIFELQFNTQFNQNNKLYSLTEINGRQYDPSETAIDMFSKSNSNEIVRGEDISIKKEGEDNYIIWKYVGRSPDGETARSNTEQRSANFIIYRLADVLLMKAEALAQLDQFQEAGDIINEIRERADQGPLIVSESRNAFEDAILHERSLEFAFEGKRWFDLMRMGRRNDFERKQALIDIIVKNVPSTQRRVIRSKLENPDGWYMPIYETELERNKFLIQNSYYNF